MLGMFVVAIASVPIVELEGDGMFDFIGYDCFFYLGYCEFIAGFEFAQFVVGVDVHLVPFDCFRKQEHEVPSLYLVYRSTLGL